ncbi:DUF1292 domain-containing protein [Lutibacter sp. B2]|nr:DUF1292 domain-containing protein [Lutibacter sp. B2]
MKEQIVTLFDENGEKINFEIIATLAVENTEYTILSPLDQKNEEGVLIFKVIEIDGEEVLENIQDEEEANLVINEYEKLMDEEK